MEKGGRRWQRNSTKNTRNVYGYKRFVWSNFSTCLIRLPRGRLGIGKSGESVYCGLIDLRRIPYIDTQYLFFELLNDIGNV